MEIVQRKQQCLKARGALLDESYSVISRHQGARLTYGALDKKSKAFAQGLLALGVKKGDRVAVMLGNNIEYGIVCSLEIGYKTALLIGLKATYGLFELGAILVRFPFVLDAG